MATTGYVEALLQGLPDDARRVLTQIFRYLVPNTRFGPVEDRTKSESFQAYFYTATTDASTGEFSIQHGLSRVPYLVIPVLPLDQVGARTVPLEVTRAADAQRIYLKSTSTSAAFAIFVE